LLILKLSIVVNDFLKFLKKIDNIKPVQNSKPAKDITSNVVVINMGSSLIIPLMAI